MLACLTDLQNVAVLVSGAGVFVLVVLALFRR